MIEGGWIGGTNRNPSNSEEERERNSEGVPIRFLLVSGFGAMNFRSLDEFWAFYMGQHSKAATRRLHFAGTLVALLCLLFSPLVSRWLLLAGPAAGYAIAWYSHFFVERNTPATFGHPVWSFLCDFRMFFLMLTGQMDKEIKRLGKRPVIQAF